MEKCAAPGCIDLADPRWFVHVNGVALPACDGHGCARPAEPCRECARKQALDDLRSAIAVQLTDVESLFPAGDYKLTLVARHVVDDDAHIVVSADDMQLAVAALSKLHAEDDKA
jgi:hypothetical protein